MENSLSTMSLDTLVNKLIDLSVSFGSKLLVALLVFFIGRWIVKKLNRLVINILTKRHVEASLATFTKSLVSITLNFTLVIIIISVLGIETNVCMKSNLAPVCFLASALKTSTKSRPIILRFF